MNQIKVALDKGLSEKQSRIINILVGVAMASELGKDDKKDCINFLRDLENYIDGLYDLDED